MSRTDALYDDESLPRRLHPGRQTIPRTDVDAIQRARLVVATSAAAAIGGYRTLSVDTIIATAGMSRRTFYMHFSNKEEAFRAAFGRAAARIDGRLARSVDAQPAPEPAAALIDTVDAEPEAAQIVFVEAVTAGDVAAALHHATVTRLTSLLTKQPEPSVAARVVVSGICETIREHMSTCVPETLGEAQPAFARVLQVASGV